MRLFMFFFLNLLSCFAQAYSWAPHSHERHLEEAIMYEKRIHIKAVEDGQSFDYGRSHTEVDLIEEFFLRDVRKTFDKKRKKAFVPVIDIGAGTGSMTWKAVIARASVVAVERLPQAAEILKNEWYQKALWHCHIFDKSQVQVVVTDFLNLSPKLNEKFEIAWAGHSLEYFSPAQVPAFSKKLYEVLKPSGRAYLKVSTPSTMPSLDEYFKARDEGKEYPGYSLVSHFESHSEFGYNPYIYPKKTKWEFLEADKNLRPGGIFQVKGPSVFDEKTTSFIAKLNLSETKNISEPLGRGEYRRFSVVNHQFDHQTLTRIFKSAGFNIKDIFYENHKYSYINPKKFTDEMRNDPELGEWHIGLVIEKPGIIEPKKEKRRFW